MKKLIMFLALAGCANKVEVPAQVTTTQCIQKSDGTCTTNFEVRHIIAIELPAVLTDTCKATWNANDFPDEAIRTAGYNKCIQDYINSILELIKGINPTDLPQVDTLPAF